MIRVPNTSGSSTAEGATVSTESILTWVLTVTTGLLPSQSKTLAVLVAAAIRCERPNLATIGPVMAGPITAKSAIKRAWRFTGNQRIEVADAMAEVITKLVRKRQKRLLVSFDWTEFRRFHTLMAAACIKGRSVPLLQGLRISLGRLGVVERSGPAGWGSSPSCTIDRQDNPTASGTSAP